MSTLTFTLVQSDLRWETPEANLQALERKIEGLQGKTQVVVLPEMFSTGFSMNPATLAEEMNGETIHWMKKLSARERLILTGSVMVREGDHYFNRLVWMLPNGQMGTYDKRHLFAYAGEHEAYTPGTQRLIASANGWRILLLTCYDLRFPVWSRQQVRDGAPEYDAIIYVANWPERRSHAWKTLLVARAIENQCYVIGVNRVGTDGHGIYHSGNSMVVDPLGEVLYHKADEEDVFTLTLDRAHVEQVRERFPFWRDADGFELRLEPE